MRFLVIDDSTTMRRILVNTLTRLGYPDVIEAADGREALQRLAEQTVDVIITDWQMGNMNGLEFVRSIRSAPATSHIPVVMVTANAGRDDIVQALNAGVNSYIVKPFTPETIRAKIERLVS